MLARLPLRDLMMPHKRDGLLLYEQDSTAWVHFSLLDSAMSSSICPFIDNICFSSQRGKLCGDRHVQQSSLSVVSVRLFI